jgi:hypothetical protein
MVLLLPIGVFRMSSFYRAYNETDEIAFEPPVFERLEDVFHTARAEVALVLEKKGVLSEGSDLLAWNHLPIPMEKPENEDPYEWDLYAFLSLDEFPYEMRDGYERVFPEVPVFHRGGAV